MNDHITKKVRNKCTLCSKISEIIHTYIHKQDLYGAHKSELSLIAITSVNIGF